MSELSLSAPSSKRERVTFRLKEKTGEKRESVSHPFLKEKTLQGALIEIDRGGKEATTSLGKDLDAYIEVYPRKKSHYRKATAKEEGTETYRRLLIRKQAEEALLSKGGERRGKKRGGKRRYSQGGAVKNLSTRGLWRGKIPFRGRREADRSKDVLYRTRPDRESDLQGRLRDPRARGFRMERLS